MQNDTELTCLYWTTAGVYPGRGEISRFDFKERVEAVARAGFSGIGIWHTELEHIMARRTLKEMKSILDDNGIRHLELEFLTDWFLDGARKAESDSRRRRLLEASAALNASHVKVGDLYNASCPLPHAVEAFGALCAEAQRYDAKIGFELMQCAMVDNLRDALIMVETASAPNGGLVIDIWQMVTLGIAWEEIQRIPSRYLISVELNDGLLLGNPGYDPSNRRLCGAGEFDLPGFIACVKEIGYSGPWAVEIIAEELASLPLEELSRRAFDTTLAMFTGQ